MFVKEAIALLQLANPEDVLILSTDEEGNGYREANVSIDESFYRDSDGALECVSSDDENEDVQTFGAVVLW